MISDVPESNVYLREITSALASSFANDKLSVLLDPKDVDADGKRVRGMLALLCCESISGNFKEALPIATAYEMLHFASLIQDDIIDGSPIRRGKQSIPHKYGSAKAILISDAYIFGVLHQLSSFEHAKITKKQLCMIASQLHSSLIATVHGEALDVALGNKETVTLEDYLNMIKWKTGALFSAPAACGAIVGGGSNEEIAVCANFGEKQGTAFQIMDDLIDITSEPKKARKPIFTDLKNRRVNAVVLHFLLNSESSAEKTFIHSLMGKESTPEEISKAVTIFKDNGSIQFAFDLATKEAGEGNTNLDILKPSLAKDKLISLSKMLLSRER
jgi:geranylgeranyl pyrophosphate synthase